MLNWNELESEIIRLCTENPDFRYPVDKLERVFGDVGCRYNPSPDGEIPGCLFGQALRNMNYVVSELMENVPIYTILYDAVPAEELTPERVNWAMHIQHRQDSGMSWGIALALASTDPLY